jgi:hypothetical protein
MATRTKKNTGDLVQLGLWEQPAEITAIQLVSAAGAPVQRPIIPSPAEVTQIAAAVREHQQTRTPGADDRRAPDPYTLNPPLDHGDKMAIVKKIVRELERVCASGNRPSQVFADWLERLEASIIMAPRHLESLRRDEGLAQDPPEYMELWARMRERYRQDHYFQYFDRASALLVMESPPYQDILGALFMEWGNPNPRSGQFFTPYEVAFLMASMTVYDGAGEVMSRVDAAIATDEKALARRALGEGLEGDALVAWKLAYCLPLVAHVYKPIEQIDPCIGSGVMMLALAACYPDWAVKLGLVQFYGQDIDALCCTMARINFRLNGLNGLGRGDAVAWVQQQIDGYAEPWASRAKQINEEDLVEHQAEQERLNMMLAAMRGLISNVLEEV